MLNYCGFGDILVLPSGSVLTVTISLAHLIGELLSVLNDLQLFGVELLLGFLAWHEYLNLFLIFFYYFPIVIKLNQPKAFYFTKKW